MKAPQIGRMTLFQVAELFDEITAIRVACAHEMQRAGRPYEPKPGEHATRDLKTLAALSGQTLSISRALRVKQLWKDWTGRDGVTLSTVQGFLWSHKLSELTD